MCLPPHPHLIPRRPTWFGVAVVFYGLVYYLPIVFGEQSDSGESGGEAHLDIIIAALVEVPATLLVAFTIDVEWIGRRRLIWIPALVASGALVFCIILDLGACRIAPCLPPPSPLLTLHARPPLARRQATLLMRSPSSQSSASRPASPCSSRTRLRCTRPTFARRVRASRPPPPPALCCADPARAAPGLGMGSAFNRLGGIVTPLMVEGLHDNSIKAPFWGATRQLQVGPAGSHRSAAPHPPRPLAALLIAALLVAICGGCLPVETTGQSLAKISLDNVYQPPEFPTIDLDMDDEEEGKSEEDQTRKLLDTDNSDTIRAYRA